VWVGAALHCTALHCTAPAAQHRQHSTSSIAAPRLFDAHHTVGWCPAALLSAPQVGGAPITLLCHSAGGWLGRVFMLEFGVTGIDR
jgi:hypothetical protein